jgi:vancomycin resistance protein VanW
MQLQENKAVNLSIAAPKVSGILIKPGQTFSFWKLVGSCTQRKGYREGLLISGGEIESGIGGGLCQFTNLIHWMALHTPLEIREHHHHDGLDMFPDFGRQVPFGVGTSIMHNYLDYRLTNNTDAAFQLIIYVTAEYLCGELRSDKPADVAYHITVENERFTEERGQFYRNNEIYRKCIDKRTGDTISNELIKKNHAQVMYDKSHIPEGKIVPQE